LLDRGLVKGEVRSLEKARVASPTPGGLHRANDPTCALSDKQGFIQGRKKGHGEQTVKVHNCSKIEQKRL
jgi:hypothetical protein